MARGISREEAKRWWLRCISCSEASFTQHNRSLGLEETDREQSMGLFSGGFLHQGDACGLLQGSVWAAGSRAAQRFPRDAEVAASSALSAAVELVKQYPQLSGSTDCRELTGIDLTTLSGRVTYMRKGKAKMCGRLSLGWVEGGPAIIDEVLDRCQDEPPPVGRSCVAEAVERIDGLDASDAVHLAGCAGGVGLSGNVCAVLAAGVFVLASRRYDGHGPEQRDSRLAGAVHELGFQVGLRKRANALRRAFEERFGSRVCAKITQRRFVGLEDHFAFIRQGGCEDVIAFTAARLAAHANE